MYRSTGRSLALPEKIGNAQAPQETGELLVPDLQIPTQIFRGTSKIGGATVGYTLEVPEDIIDPVPLGIVHGYTGIEQAYIGLRNYTARNGKPSFTYDTPRNLDIPWLLDPRHILFPNKLLGQAVWGTMHSIAKNKQNRVDGTVYDLAGHSMGTPTSIHLAHLKNDHVRSVMMIAGAGMEDHNLVMLLTRLPGFLKEEVAPAI
ncbi:MAG: hypothetical protein AAB914_04745, partial [Patescibacteria group bacterium]